MAARRPQPVEPAKPTALVGSAQILKASRVTEPKNVAWQSEAWGMWRSTPEPSFAANWVGRGFSRCRLYVARRPQRAGDEPEPVTDGPAVDLLASLGGGMLGQQQLLHSFGVHMTVPGIGYLTGQQAVGAFDSWQVLSADELKVSGKSGTDALGRKVQLYEVLVDEGVWQPAPADTLVVKCWRPDEQFHFRPWSPMQPVLGVLRELDGLTKKIDADIVSRLASAGIILIPSEVEFPVRPEFADADDPFMAEIIAVITTAIRDRASAAANSPIFIRIPGEYVDKVKHLTWATPLDEMAIELRKEARGRFAVGMDMPAEVLTGLGNANHWCSDSETEILTPSGWVGHGDLGIGDSVLTLNHETGLSEWQPVEDIYRADVVDEPMLSIEQRYHSSLTTMNHRWPILRQGGGVAPYTNRAWATSESMYISDRIIAAAPHAELPAAAKYSDAFVELVAWVFTEGTYRGSKANPSRQPQVAIGQSWKANPHLVARIRGVLSRLYGPATTVRMPTKTDVPMWRENSESRGMTLFALNKAAAAPLFEVIPDKRKIVSREFILSLTLAQLELFLDTAAVGDGGINSGGGRLIGQRLAARLDCIELAGILAGHAVRRFSRLTGGFEQKQQWHQSVMTGRRDNVVPKAKMRSAVLYSGIVWCPVTTNRTWLARRHGQVFYTGNSLWEIGETGVKYHIAPGMEAIVQGITIGFLQPGLEVLGAPDPELLVWFDASELTTRPDLSANTQALYDRLEVGPRTLRRETGVNESDKPTPAELAEMVLKRALTNPALFQSAAEGLGVTLVEEPMYPEPGAPDETPTDVTLPNSPPAVPVDVNPPPPNAALVAAADGLVCRALEKAGNRVRQKLKPAKGAKNDCPPMLIHECIGGVTAAGCEVPVLLAGAWDRVPEIAQRLHVDPVWLGQSLELYTAGLLDTGVGHTWEDLESFLTAEALVS